jgi:hypothetical protein
MLNRYFVEVNAIVPDCNFKKQYINIHERSPCCHEL